MVVKFCLPSGLEIFGLPTKNFYGGHWDLGPTWNYAVMADKPFLVDCGRYGRGKDLLGMMQAAGISPRDLEFVLISHSHEDHDGGLSELVESTRITVRAHTIYGLLIRQYPRIAPGAQKRHFPAKCWHCFMPQSFVAENCLDYHRVLSRIEVEPIADGVCPLGPDIYTHHLPGHSPDSLAVQLGGDALIAGDVVLPGITPWPTRRELFSDVEDVLQPLYADPGAIFGLLRYIRSLKHLETLSERHPDMAVFPGHRFYYRDRWHTIEMAARLREIIEHHVQRCGAILEIVSTGPKSADDIAREHFTAPLLKGFGKLMAANEIISHCELMATAGDLVAVGKHRYESTGSRNFENLIHSDDC